MLQPATVVNSTYTSDGMDFVEKIVGWIGVPFVIYCAYLFVGKPFSRFYDIRIDVAEKLAEYDNVNPQLDLERTRKAETEFRKLGTQLMALAGNHRAAVWLLKCRNYDPAKAGRGLIGLSNSLRPTEETTHWKHARKQEITSALRL